MTTVTAVFATVKAQKQTLEERDQQEWKIIEQRAKPVQGWLGEFQRAVSDQNAGLLSFHTTKQPKGNCMELRWPNTACIAIKYEAPDQGITKDFGVKVSKNHLFTDDTPYLYRYPNISCHRALQDLVSWAAKELPDEAANVVRKTAQAIEARDFKQPSFLTLGRRVPNFN